MYYELKGKLIAWWVLYKIQVSKTIIIYNIIMSVKCIYLAITETESQVLLVRIDKLVKSCGVVVAGHI